MGLNAVLILALSLLTGRRVKVSAQEINVQQTQPPAGEALDIRFVASVDAFANRHHEKTLLRKNEDSSKVQKVELRSIHSLLASFTTRGFTRHKRSDPVGETTGMSANYIPNNDFLPWTKNQMFKNMVTTASQEKNGVAVSFSPAANTVKPAWSRSAHYAQVYDYCVSLTTNSSLLKNQSHENSQSEVRGKHGVCERENKSGFPVLWAILYMLIVLFLFIALAVICDDFFVPSLEVISERLNLSEDVAGATFMAAGSSAPELFTSVAGVGTGSDVGVGTIVGSAVFNLLVIIALTAALSGRVLQIDWRPLVRDSVFYGGSVMIFILFSWDGQFVWWESLLLLLLYVAYIITMKFNQRLLKFLDNPTCSCVSTPDVSRVSPTHQTSPRLTSGSEGLQQSKESSQSNRSETVIVRNDMNSSEAAKAPPQEKTPGHEEVQEGCCMTSHRCCCCCCCCKRLCSCISSSTSAKAAAANSDAKASKAVPVVYKDTSLDEPILCADCTDEMYLEDGPADSKLDGDKPDCGLRKSKTVENGVGCRGIPSNKGVRSRPPSYDSIRFANEERKQRTCSIDLSIERRRTSSMHVLRRNSKRFRSTYRKSSSASAGVAGPLQNGDVKVSEFHVSEISDNYLAESPAGDNNAGTSFGSSTTTLEVPKDISASKRVVVTMEKAEEKEERENDETLIVFPCLPPIKHSPPDKPDSSHCVPSAKYIGRYFLYILSFPWICAFTWTIPDCSKDENKKWYVLSFLISIAWIAAISYLMVEVVDLIGCLMGIDPYTMGLVVIAVGTSIPDALSSILVAREGYGDMAVSNAIGSNVFDINLGLGLPFLIRSAITSKPVHLLSPVQGCLLDNLTLSVRIVPHVKFGLILLLVLAICFFLFLLVRFRLNKTVGIIFVGMYVAFVVYALIQEKSCYAFFC